MSRIYLQVLEVNSLEVIYWQAYWRYFTSRNGNASKRYWGSFHWRDRAAADLLIYTWACHVTPMATRL